MATGSWESKPPLPWSPPNHLRPLNNSTGESSVSSGSTVSSGCTENDHLPWSHHYHLKPLNGSTGEISLSSGSSNGSGLYSNPSFSINFNGSSPPSSDPCRKIPDRTDRDVRVRETGAAQTENEGPSNPHRQDFLQPTKVQHQSGRSTALETPWLGNERRGEDVQIGRDVETLKKTTFPKPHWVIGIVIVLLMVAAIVGAIVYIELQKASDLGKIYQTTGLVSVSVDDTFKASMADNSSEEFSAFSKKFCDSAGTILGESDSVDVVACTVHSLSKGSIVTTFTLELQTTFNTSSDWLKDFLQNSGAQDDGFTYWFNLRINRFSISIASIKSKLSDSTVLGPYTSKVDCTQSFLPLPYTYPNYCGEYQACTSTGIKYLRCPEDTEFSYDPSRKTDNTVCERRSENTYCGQRRREDVATTMTTARRRQIRRRQPK
ncbi:uncharacterized protein LOC112554887 isoform X2 [Pomacea canaliculata]|uniref:uncharacterized protein LOC112554887 isoform X2 n=1 Tax=Pomacea canaliculata TaxID=400727 RepID=UPI000D73E465|nr:uncharacterized protein LOC112554887 isoform X2 [Pomacea canaliculata]